MLKQFLLKMPAVFNLRKFLILSHPSLHPLLLFCSLSCLCVSSMRSHGQVKWYTLPFQLMHVLFLWYIRPKDGSFVNLKGKIYYCLFSKKFQSSKMVHFTFPIDVYSILMVYQTRKGSQIHFQLLLV